MQPTKLKDVSMRSTQTPLPPQPRLFPGGDPVEAIAAELERLHPMHTEPPRTQYVEAPVNNVPDYVTHDPAVNQVGRLTAEAAAIEYEAAAKAVDAMGKQLTELQQRLEKETQTVHAVLLEIMTLAEKYRDEGMRAFKRIEEASKMTQNVRETCAELTKKLL